VSFHSSFFFFRRTATFPQSQREPDCEGQETQAVVIAQEEEKRGPSSGLAVGFFMILGESMNSAMSGFWFASSGMCCIITDQYPSLDLRHTGTCSCEKASLPESTPVMMVVEHDRQIRRTHPAVPSSNLCIHPYTNDMSALPTESRNIRAVPRAREFIVVPHDRTHSTGPNGPRPSQPEEAKAQDVYEGQDTPDGFWEAKSSMPRTELGYALGLSV